MLEHSDELLIWVEYNLTNLDKQDHQQGLEEIFQNALSQGSPEEKAARYLRIKKWFRAFNALAIGICLWAWIYPEPYSAVIGATLALPFLALLMLWRYQDIARFSTKANGPYLDVSIVLLMPGLALGMRSFLDWHVLDWSPFWIPFTAISLGLLGFALLLVRDIWQKSSSILLMALFAGIYGLGATVVLNGTLADHNNATIYHVEVLDKHIAKGNQTTYYLKLAPWGNRSVDDTQVSWKVYSKYEPGDTAKIRVLTGKFGIPFYCVQ